jgi:hypothetical protein
MEAGYLEKGHEEARSIVTQTFIRGWQKVVGWTRYRGGNVGIGGGAADIPTKLLHLFTTLIDDFKIQGSSTSGSGVLISATAPGGRDFNMFSSANTAGPGPGKLIIWDAATGLGMHLTGANGALRLTGYGAGIAQFDSSGNLTAYPTLPLPTITTPTFANAWVSYGAGPTPRAAGYYKTGAGIVHLCGTIKNGTVGLKAFTLPAGSRPLGTLYFTVYNPAAGSSCMIQVDPNGDVTPQSGVNTAYAMDSVAFLAEQ